jgi:hypothetical protein
VREMKNRNSRMRMVSMVSILLTMQKKYTLENDPLQALITMREFQFFESIIEKHFFCIFSDFNVVFFCVEKDFLITEMGVSDEAKNVIPLEFLRKIPLVNSIRGQYMYSPCNTPSQ